MMKLFLMICSLMVTMVTFSCVKNEQNPYQNPDNAKIETSATLSNMTGSLKTATAYSCSVAVYLPALVDSMVVRVGHDGVDSVLYRLAINDSPLIIFSFSPEDTGRYDMQIIIVKNNGAKDSLPEPKEFLVLDFAPQLSPVAAVYHTSIGDSIIVQFHVVARDSNLYAYFTSLSLDPDSVLSHLVYYYYAPLSHISNDTIRRTLKGKILLEGLKEPLVCYAQAFNRADAYSTVASCTIFVADTTKPQLTLLPPHTNVRDSIVNLPDSIIVRAVDAAGIDSVTLNGVKMLCVSDTMTAIAKQAITTLSQGENYDTIIAWDKARNSDTILLTLAYGGPPTYPPKIKLLDKSIPEGRKFDTLFLDTCIIVTDSAITDIVAYKASLLWSITDSAGNQVPTYNSTARKLVIPVKSDSEWTDTFNLNFKVIDKNGLSDSRVAAFKVNEVPDPPVMNIKSVQSKFAGTPFDTLFLDTCAKDPDNASTTLMWTFKNGKIFKIDSLFSFRLSKSSSTTSKLRIFNRHIAVVPIDTTKAGWKSWTGVDTLMFIVSDPGGRSQKKSIIFEKYSLKPIIIDTLMLPFLQP